MKPALAKSIIYSFVLLLVLLAVNAGISYHHTRMLHENAQIGDSYEILKALSDAMLLVRDAESGQRGYILTGDPTVLEHYQSAFSARGEVLGRLQRLTADRPEQRASVSHCYPRWPRWRPLQMMADSLRLRAAPYGSW